MADRSYRTADPYRDTDVIDGRGPRANQLVVGLVSLIGVTTGLWWLLALVALQLVLGLTLGRRWCLACVAYFELIQPRMGEGPLEDARPPRFANAMGVVVLGAASVAYLVGGEVVGAALGLLVAALALLSAFTGFCTGCQIYKVYARLRGLGRGHGHIERVEPADFGGDLGENTVVQFTHPLCSDCHRLERELRESGRRVVAVDVRRSPDLARKYGVGVVPTAVAVDGTGRVLARLA
jgi:thiol-disulfide isomerase/thioredoxin